MRYTFRIRNCKESWSSTICFIFSLLGIVSLFVFLYSHNLKTPTVLVSSSSSASSSSSKTALESTLASVVYKPRNTTTNDCFVLYPDTIPRYAFYPVAFFNDIRTKEYMKNNTMLEQNMDRLHKSRFIVYRKKNGQIVTNEDLCSATPIDTPKQPSVLYYHIHKCGGSTMQNILQPSPTTKHRFPSTVWTQDVWYQTKEKQMGSLRFHEEASAVLQDNIFLEPQSPVFTFVRDPLSRFISSINELIILDGNPYNPHHLPNHKKHLTTIVDNNNDTALPSNADRDDNGSPKGDERKEILKTCLHSDDYLSYGSYNIHGPEYSDNRHLITIMECVIHAMETEQSYLNIHFLPQTIELYYGLQLSSFNNHHHHLLAIDIMDLQYMSPFIEHFLQIGGTTTTNSTDTRKHKPRNRNEDTFLQKNKGRYHLDFASATALTNGRTNSTTPTSSSTNGTNNQDRYPSLSSQENELNTIIQTKFRDRICKLYEIDILMMKYINLTSTLSACL